MTNHSKREKDGTDRNHGGQYNKDHPKKFQFAIVIAALRKPARDHPSSVLLIGTVPLTVLLIFGTKMVRLLYHVLQHNSAAIIGHPRGAAVLATPETQAYQWRRS
jgi:hypothetical protein